MNRPGVAVLPYPLQRALVRNLAVPAQQAGRREFLALWAGQSAGLAQYPDVATLLQSLVNGVSEKLGSAKGAGSEQTVHTIAAS